MIYAISCILCLVQTILEHCPSIVSQVKINWNWHHQVVERVARPPIELFLTGNKQIFVINIENHDILGQILKVFFQTIHFGRLTKQPLSKAPETLKVELNETYLFHIRLSNALTVKPFGTFNEKSSKS